MASQYFALLTDYGKQAFAKALSSQQPMQLATFAVGDGNGQNVTPTANQTALAREKYRAAVSAVSLDPRNNKQVIVELTMPENVGGFYIREMGVFDNQNKLVAYANCPESFKPTLESGTGKVQVLRMILQVASSAAVALSVDHSVIFVTRQQHTPKTITATSDNGFDETGHTHQIDKASLIQQGIVQLNSATNSDNETMAATPKAVKTAYDLADGKQSPATTLAGYGIGNFKVEPFVGNLNTLKTDGVYAITQASRSQNLPVSTSCHIQVIAGGDGAWCRQLAYVAYSTDVYERHQTSYQTDSWSPWVKIDSLDKIPNSKKSSAVDSDSADTVATSAAVKIAYDKGVEAKTAADGAQRTANDGVAKAKTAQAAAEAAQRTANDGVSKATTAQTTANSAVTKADNAQRAADNANNNANNRVSKSGDTMTGNLIIDSSNAAWSALLLRNRQNKYLVYEVNPDTESNAFGSMIYRGTDGGNIFKLQLPKRNGEIAVKEDVNLAQRTAESANNNANNRVSKSGDTMTGNLVVKNGSPWSSVVLDNNQGQGIKLESRPNDDGFMGEISHLDIHNGYRNINTLLLPKKSGTLALEADVNGKAPLTDFERVKNNYYDKSGFAERSYPSHYNGAHVWTMRFNQFGGLRIIQLRAEIKNSSGTVPIYLPEEMTTQSLSIATDDGYVKYSYGSKVTSNNIVTVYTPQNKTVGINLFVIGWVNF